MDDYVELTSFTHKPYYETFSPEVPDNWENQPMYNLPLDELIGAIDYALNKGYTVCWMVTLANRVSLSRTESPSTRK